ncbi:hypothetical protein E4U32_006665 [Claviceps aff. humidiphila group G2b]|nr:hypothetical protein E4U32_006665 [Claviceps aff. humidiphila group G2b]
MSCHWSGEEPTKAMGQEFLSDDHIMTSSTEQQRIGYVNSRELEVMLCGGGEDGSTTDATTQMGSHARATNLRLQPESHWNEIHWNGV